MSQQWGQRANQFSLLPKEQIKTARFCWFQMQSFGFCDFFSLLKGILMNNTDPFVPRFPFLKRLCQDNIIHQGENVSTGGCSSFAEGLPCLFLNRNWALSKYKFLFQSKCPWVPQHLLFSGNINFILVPKLLENERNHLKNYVYFLWQNDPWKQSKCSVKQDIC